MNKIIVSLVVVILLAAGAIYLFRGESRVGNRIDDQKIQVVASFYPLYFFAQEIGGDKVAVTNLTPAGAEPHEYELTPQDTAIVESSDLLVLNGGGLEAWGDSVQKNIDVNKTHVVIAGQDLATLQANEDGQTTADPHIWLSPPLAQKMAEKIAEGLQAVDPANANFYATRLVMLNVQLGEFDADFKNGLATCTTRDIITSHEAFNYLAAAYDLRQVAISGVSTEEEPSAQDLADLTEFAKENNINYIFFESLVSPKLAETLAREVGAETLVLDPLEGLSDDDIKEGKNYFSQMQANLTNLQTALECRT
jgi:zinc transport system substrate-binding protein